MEYTSGPWEYDNTQDNYYGNVIRKNGIIIAKMIHGQGTTVLEHNANARLIVSCPDLLEACIQAYIAIGDLTFEECEKPLSNGRVLAMIQAAEKVKKAITKTEGNNP